MKKLIIFLVLTNSSHFLNAQSHNINKPQDIETTKQLFKALMNSPNLDSLRQLAASKNDNGVRPLVLFALTVQYLNSNLDSSLKYVKQFNGLSSKSKFWEANGDVVMGDIYLRLGNSSLALKNLLKGTKILQELNDSSGMGIAYWNLGKLYQSVNDYSKAISYYSISIKISSSAKENGPLIYSMIYLGNLYVELGSLDSALFYTRSAYKIRYEMSIAERRTFMPILLAQLGNIYQKQRNVPLARTYYKMALKEAYSTNNLEAGISALLGMAMMFKNENEFDSSYHYSIEALNMARRLNKPDLLLKTQTFLKDLFKEKGILDSSFKYQEVITSERDSLEKLNRISDISLAEQQWAHEAEAQQKELQTKLKLYGLVGSLIIFLFVAVFLYINNRQKQKLNILLHQQKNEIQRTLSELKTSQSQLIQSEKMASLGELTAGIAHEIQNPLNFVNNFSEVNREMLEELKAERLKPNAERDESLQDELINNVIENLKKINHHGKRADAIVKGMLQHSRQSSGQKEPTDINALADEYLRLSYHGMRAKDKSFNVDIKTDFDESIGKINIIPQDIGRVLLNLFNNAFYAVSKSQEEQGKEFEPSVSVSTKKSENSVLITVSDNGNGIPQKNLDKIFQPFFTTKPTGDGTGLGLSLSYDIVKAHSGEIKVESKEGEGTEFIIQIAT
ncbi:MAG: ATP-binding protein [Ginsengibacter sp.]